VNLSRRWGGGDDRQHWGLAYEETLHGVTQQQEVLDGAWARASTPLGIAAVSASPWGAVAHAR
jgi:hypothetical protein